MSRSVWNDASVCISSVASIRHIARISTVSVAVRALSPVEDSTFELEFARFPLLSALLQLVSGDVDVNRFGNGVDIDSAVSMLG